MSVPEELLKSTNGKLIPERQSGIKEVVTTPKHIAKEMVQAVSNPRRFMDTPAKDIGHIL